MLLGNCLKHDMLKSVILMIIFMVTVLALMSANAQEKSVLLREDFNNLENWRPLNFPKIKEHTKYYIEKEETGSYLKAESNSSASGIIYKSEFNIVQYSKVRWRWKINNIFAKGNAKKKSGDDYPLRVYIIFKYNPDKASFGQKLKYGFAKAVYGEYPPHSSLNYIWANRQHEQNIIANPYAKEAQMIILQTGKENTGKWIEQEIDINEDYRRAFSADPPATFSLAIMNDSDNTKESAVSYIDYIEVYR